MSSMRYKTIALVDCNNFYASCERIFNPALNHKPVLVLSNNDGCVIARSNEVKVLGIKMGQPYFQIESLCKRHQVNVFSSNFALYGDISHRVMATLQMLCPDIEIYSIDEAFVRLDTIAVDALQYAEKIRETILQHIGIPVSIGIAPTKTLAKVAAHIAKKNPACDGVYDLRSQNVRDIILADFPVQALWGVGRQFSEKLQQLKIHTAKQLCEQPSGFLQKKFGITMTRLTEELKGRACLSLTEIQNNKNIMCSRSFGKPATDLSDLLEAISCYAARACEKARTQKIKAQGVCVYLRTSPFNKTKPFYSASEQQTLLLPSNDTVLMTRIATELIQKIFKPHYQYQKVGIILLDLLSEKILQHDLLVENTHDDNQKLMTLLDKMNRRFGSHTLFLAAEGINQEWKIKQIRRSPRYTTCWDELVISEASAEVGAKLFFKSRT